MGEDNIFHHRERIFLRDLEFDNKIDDMKMYETPYYCLFAGVTIEQKVLNFKIKKVNPPEIIIGYAFKEPLKITKINFQLNENFDTAIDKIFIISDVKILYGNIKAYHEIFYETSTSKLKEFNISVIP